VKGSHNWKKAVKKHLRIQRQRKDHAVKLARCVVMSNDFIALEDLSVRNMKRNRHLSESISDVGWTQFRHWVDDYGKVFGKVVVAVNPAYTSQICSNCGRAVRKDLKMRRHICGCGVDIDRNFNAAVNILKAGLRMAERGRKLPKRL